VRLCDLSKKLSLNGRTSLERPARYTRAYSRLAAAAGDLTDAQISAVKMATIARFAGTKNICPHVHFGEAASFKVMADAGIEPDLLQSPEFGDVVTEAALVAIEKQRENPSDFCEATWKLFGPGGALRWQMLEAN
jgi:hypothetical protein